MKSLISLVVLVVVAMIAFNLFTFTVDETEVALVLQFGDVKQVVVDPGLHFKVPFVQNVIHFDARLQVYDVQPREIIISDPVVEQLRLLIDNYALWRVTKPQKFAEAVRGNFNVAQTRLDDLIFSNVRNVLGGHTLVEIVSTERDEFTESFTKQSAKEARDLGVEIVDVRLKRTDLPDSIKEDVFRLMRADRQQAATELRAGGEKRSREIRSEADKQVTIILANAQQEAQNTRGQGDAQALKIYADAYSQNSEFYRFWRTLESYRQTFSKSGSGTLLLSTESEYLQLLDVKALKELMDALSKPN